MPFLRWLKAPYRYLRSQWESSQNRKRYGSAEDYNAEQYWTDRHSDFGFDLRGVGNKGLTQEENEAQYREGKATFLQLLSEEKISLEGKNVLDVGCGIGFYAGILQEQKVASYRGLDITNALFPKLEERFPGFVFNQVDVSTAEIEGEHDVVIMIDVTQHITNEDKFAFAMQNLKRVVKKGGQIVLTSWLSEQESHSFYERSRTLAAYQEQFSGWNFGKPRSFRDKFIFVVSRPA